MASINCIAWKQSSLYEKAKHPTQAYVKISCEQNSVRLNIKKFEEKYSKYNQLFKSKRKTFDIDQSISQTVGSTTTITEALDFKTILKNSQSISGEIVLKNLLEKMFYNYIVFWWKWQ